jgi:UDP-N-acetylglucosamine--N-acetylmuramyl-(pentapeptide) pyrophosphoryl-undecaprenol N-acetylglucosamine transferase
MGFGGYPVFAAGIAAWLSRVPLILHEQNAVLGRANRVLAPLARQLALSFQDTARLSPRAAARAVVTGNPIRAAFRTLADVPYPAVSADGDIRVLVLGGSLGARVFGTLLPEALALLPEDLRQRLVLVQQCRAEDLPAVERRYQELGLRFTIAPFLEDVPAQLAAAHLVIARSGASTIAELEAAGRPALLVPYPHAMDDHQTANARQLAARGAAWVMAEGGLTATGLAEGLRELLTTPVTLTAAAAAAKNAASADPAQRLAGLADQARS